MINSIYFAVLLALFGVVCYMMPQAFDKSYANDDNLVSIHKIEYTSEVKNERYNTAKR